MQICVQCGKEFDSTSHSPKDWYQLNYFPAFNIEKKALTEVKSRSFCSLECLEHWFEALGAS